MGFQFFDRNRTFKKGTFLKMIVKFIGLIALSIFLSFGSIQAHLVLTSTGTKLLLQDTSKLNNITVLLEGLVNVTHIKPAIQESAIFLADFGARAIKKLSLIDHDITVIISNVNPLGLTYDWLSRNLYWTNFGGSIEVSDVKGTNRRTLFLGTTNEPKDITLDPKVGYLFWTDNSDNEGKIERADLDGDPTTQIAIVHNDFLRPVGIFADVLEGRLYWADIYLKYIHSCRYDGNGRKLVFMDDVIKPSTLTVLQEKLYILDNNSTVYRCDKFKCKKELLMKYTESPQDIAVVVDLQSVGKGPEDVIFVSRWNGIYKVPINNPKIRERTISVRYSRHLNFDPITKRIIWAEYEGWKEIVLKQSHIERKGQTTLDRIAVEYVDYFRGLSFDWMERKLFISVHNTISYLNLKTSRKYTIISGDIKPGEISLDPFHSLLYWINHGQQPIIQCSNYDGSNLKTIVNSKLPFQNGIMVDYVLGNIYWNDRKKHAIEAAKTDGSSRKTIHRNIRIQLDNSVTIHGDFLFWSDGYSIYRWKKTFSSRKHVKYKQHNRIFGLTSANIKKSANKAGDDKRCPTIAKCWGINNGWICLNRNMICNGKPECFGNIDEFYCCSKCGMPEISLNCKSAECNTLNNNFTLNFVMWQSHPFSDIFKEGTFFKLQCSIEAVYSDENRLKRNISIYNLQKHHVFRQVTGQGVFRNTNATFKLTLSGQILSLERRAFLQYGMLKELVIRETKITRINNNTFTGLQHLHILTISENPFLSAIEKDAFYGLFSLETLIITANGIKYIMANALDNIKTITFLNISDNRLQTLDYLLLNQLSALKVLDLRQNDLRLTSESFEHNNNLSHIYVDSYSFCCIKPPSVEERNCVAPKYDVSSCENLIQDRTLRAFLWIVGIFAILGNIIVLVYRILTKRRACFKETFSIFVSNLGVSDAIMGLYMLIIAVNDSSFEGKYVWNEFDWKRSMVCKLSGIMAFISSESSVLFIILITVDRYLVIKYPLGGRRLSFKQAHWLTLMAWIISLLTALIPVFVFDRFYSISDVCIALPLTGERRQGWLYSVVIVLGFNFIAFIFITVGQICIFTEIRLSAKRVRSNQASNEMTVAKNLSIVVLTDCLCWLPIGILVTMALTGTNISREVYAWIIVFVLPVNSAINPVLYTFIPAFKRQALVLKKRNQRQIPVQAISRGSSVEEKEVETKFYTSHL